MYMNSDMMQYIQQLNQYIQTQNKQMEQMSKLIQQLQMDLNQLKEKQTPPVIRNEYKFDLLKIETLEGTLNIGLNPHGTDSSIEEFAVDQSMNVPPVQKQNPTLFQKVQQQIHQFLKRDAYDVLCSIEDKYAYPLDEPYRKFILNDIKKQIDQRIHYYVNQLDLEKMSPDQVQIMEQKIIEKVRKDIEKSCEAFIKNLPAKEGDSSQ